MAGIRAQKSGASSKKVVKKVAAKKVATKKAAVKKSAKKATAKKLLRSQLDLVAFRPKLNSKL